MTLAQDDARPKTLDAGELLAQADHEQVVSCHDPGTGLRAIIAVHSTALGSAIGGTRFYPYATYAEALADVLRLSRHVVQERLPHPARRRQGGHHRHPSTDKSPELWHTYGRFVQTLWPLCHRRRRRHLCRGPDLVGDDRVRRRPPVERGGWRLQRPHPPTACSAVRATLSSAGAPHRSPDDDRDLRVAVGRLRRPRHR